MGPLGTFGRLCAALALCAPVGGCVSIRRQSPTTLVRRIDIDGLGGLPIGERTPYGLKQEMVHGATGRPMLTWPFNIIMRPVSHRPHVLAGDVERLQTWFAHHGWFDAMVSIEPVEVRAATRSKVAVVDLHVRIERGPITRWAALPEGPTFPWFHSKVRPGRRFRLEDAEEDTAWITRNLRERGHPEATASLAIEVDPGTDRATTVYTVEPGPEAVLGAARFELAGPQRTLRQAGALRPGGRYRASLVEAARDRLLDLGAYTDVEAGIAVEEGVATPVFRGNTGRPRQVVLGGRIGLFGLAFRAEAQARGSVALPGLHQLELGGTVGTFGTSQRGLDLVAGLNGQLRLRGLASLEVAPAVRFDRSVFLLALVRHDLSVLVPVTRRFGPVSVEIEPSVRGTQLLGTEDPAWIAALGRESVGAYGVGWLRGRLVWDRVQPKAQRLEGWRTSLDLGAGVTTAGTPIAEIGGSVTGFWAPDRVVLGHPVLLSGTVEGRIRKARGPLPWPESLFLGGASDLRGFRAGHVGVYDMVCTRRLLSRLGPDGLNQRTYVPRGGEARVRAGAELEIQRLGVPELHGAVFADAGWLDTAGVRGSGGVGLRYDTSVGPLRLDVSVRPLAPEDQGPGLGGPGSSYGCDLLPPRRRAFDLLSENGRYKPLERSLPAFNLQFSIGRPW